MEIRSLKIKIKVHNHYFSFGHCSFHGFVTFMFFDVFLSAMFIIKWKHQYISIDISIYWPSAFHKTNFASFDSAPA